MAAKVITANQLTENSGFAIVQEAHLCVDCSDQPASLTCLQCGDIYCEVCFGALHKSGNRARHQTTPLAAPTDVQSDVLKQAADAIGSTSNTSSSGESINHLESKEASASTASSSSSSSNTMTDGETTTLSSASSSTSTSKSNETVDGKQEYTESQVKQCLNVYPDIARRSQYYPLRLTDDERALLRILEDALIVSEYTDNVDVTKYDRTESMLKELVKLLSAISGLVISANSKLGRKMFQSKTLRDNAEYFRMIFEIGRRHKMRNPDKMRTTYGKLMFILMDAQQHLLHRIGFSLVSPIKTVWTAVKELEIEGLLNEELLYIATAQITAPRGIPRSAVNEATRRKQQALEKLMEKYSNNNNNNNTKTASGNNNNDDDNNNNNNNNIVTAESVRDIIASISDAHCYIKEAAGTVKEMYSIFNYYFGKNGCASNRLAITSGHQGSRLSHTHEEQVKYCQQTFVLWYEILTHMFQLWGAADDDLLAPNNHYNLRVTGQGLNRMQAAPRVGQMMRIILDRTYRQVEGGWVGSSAVHLGDINVPNALVFIDKYTQVERILSPVIRTIKELDVLANHEKVGPWLLQYYETDYEKGSIEKCKLRILVDFFRHAFDGSGADNPSSAGSCIDGRLTSAWNWCNKIANKTYYSLFLVAGFNGFEGNW